jgi:hypothetical protein
MQKIQTQIQKKKTTLRGAKSSTKGKYNIHWWICGFVL